VPKGVVIVAGARFSVSRRIASRRVPPQSVNEETRQEVARVGELAEKCHACSKFMQLRPESTVVQRHVGACGAFVDVFHPCFRKEAGTKAFPHSSWILRHIGLSDVSASLLHVDAVVVLSL
jgi:hypothetical protein